MEYYEIVVREQLEDYWAASFEGLSISRTREDETLISGDVADQAQLHGILSRIRDMGLTLIAVNKVDQGSA
jgi:hypothetical protein